MNESLLAGRTEKDSGVNDTGKFREELVMSLSTMLQKRSNSQAGSLLTGSDIPAGTKTIMIEVAAVRESPEGFSAPVILDLKKPIYGKSAWAVNKTNLKMLIKWLGEDEQKLVGKKIKLEIISVRNPQTGEIVPSLAVSPRQVA
jgi:hypothetical protein